MTLTTGKPHIGPRGRKKKKERKGPQVTFIHPQWKGANVHAKNDEGITLLDCIYGQLIMHINAVQT